MREIPVRWNHYDGSKVRFLRDSLRMLQEVVALRCDRAPAVALRLCRLDQLRELREEIAGIVRAGRRFGMILHAEDRQLAVPHALRRCRRSDSRA